SVAAAFDRCAISTASPPTKKRSARCSASSTATSATCRQCRAVSLTTRPLSCATLAVSASLHASAATLSRWISGNEHPRSTLSPHWLGLAQLGKPLLSHGQSSALVSGTRHKEPRLV